MSDDDDGSCAYDLYLFRNWGTKEDGHGSKKVGEQGLMLMSDGDVGSGVYDLYLLCN